MEDIVEICICSIIFISIVWFIGIIVFWLSDPNDDHYTLFQIIKYQFIWFASLRIW